MKKINFLSLLLCLVFLGCATDYGKQGFAGGYSDFRLAEDIFRVSFTGNGYTGGDKVENFLMRRCAEITLENGYDYFVFLDKNSNSSHSKVVHSPGSSETKGVFKRGYNNDLQYNEKTEYTAPNVTEITKHSGIAVIKLFKKGKQPSNALSANIVMSNFDVRRPTSEDIPKSKANINGECMSNNDCSLGKVCATVKGDYSGMCAKTGFDL